MRRSEMWPARFKVSHRRYNGMKTGHSRPSLGSSWVTASLPRGHPLVALHSTETTSTAQQAHAAVRCCAPTSLMATAGLRPRAAPSRRRSPSIHGPCCAMLGRPTVRPMRASTGSALRWLPHCAATCAQEQSEHLKNSQAPVSAPNCQRLALPNPFLPRCDTTPEPGRNPRRMAACVLTASCCA